MAFPRLNMISFWIAAASFALLIASFLAVGGGPLSGWTAYPPLSAIGAIAGPGEGLGQTLWFFSIGLFSISSLLTAINMIATVIDERGPGMTLMRMPLTCWNWFVTAILSLLSFSVLLAALLLILLRSARRHQLFRSRRAAGWRRGHHAQRRLAPALAASLLVLRTPRGLHRHPAGHGNRVASDCELLAQAGVRLSGDGLGFHLDRVSGTAGLGTSYVHQRPESVVGDRVLFSDHGDRRAIRGEDASTGSRRPGVDLCASPPRCCSRLASCRFLSPAGYREFSSVSPRSTPTFTTLTSWWRIFI